MDTMRNLNKSLPRASTRSRAGQPSGDLLQAFKSAALSVTQLYKTAAVDQEKARLAGYQDALDDLLAFLDQENIGVGDGEGWAIRKWATERLDSSGSAGGDNEVEAEEEKRTRSMSPVTQRPTHAHAIKEEPVAPTLAVRADSSPPLSMDQASSHPLVDHAPARPDVFHFRSAPNLSVFQDMDMASGEPGSLPSPSTSIRYDLLQRHTRPSGNRSLPGATARERSHAGSSANNTHGLGSKRKAPYSEFFDIGMLGNNTNNFWGGGGGGGGSGGSSGSNGGGGKRGRFV